MIIPDINLLVHAHNDRAPQHAEAKGWWEGLLNGRTPVGLPWIVAAGFIRLMTNPRVLERPMAVGRAVQCVRDWLEQEPVRIRAGRRRAAPPDSPAAPRSNTARSNFPAPGSRPPDRHSPRAASSPSDSAPAPSLRNSRGLPESPTVPEVNTSVDPSTKVTPSASSPESRSPEAVQALPAAASSARVRNLRPLWRGLILRV